MKTKKKTFDAVQMKRRGAEKIYQQTAKLSLAEQLEFWQKRTQALTQRQAALKRRRVRRAQTKAH